MKKTTLILLICFLLFTSNIHSQVITDNTVEDVFLKKMAMGDNAHTVSDYSKINGSPYLIDDFLDSEIYFSEDSVFKIKLRYNIYDNTMEFKHRNVVYAFTNPEIIYKIKISNNTFIYYYNKKKNKKSSYYQVLVWGKTSLLAKKRVRYQSEGKGDGIVDAKPAQFIIVKDKYFIVKDNILLQIKNKKSLLKTLNDKDNKVSQFIKKENISSSNVDDLIKLIEFYNNLK